MAYELGKPIIDELKICYSAEKPFLEDLKQISNMRMRNFGDFTFIRTSSHHFAYAYDVCIGEAGSRRKIATARFGRYGEVEETDYFFYRFENFVLYDNDLFNFTLSIPEQLGLVFHNFTSLDIAIDAKTDMARLIKRMWHREDITTILNGKAVRDRKAMLKNVSLVYSSSLDRLKGLTIYVKQAKAAHDKTKGITVQAYNKMQEIQEASHKDYIKEFYGNPQKLYRLEVHLNNVEIADYFKLINMTPDVEVVYNRKALADMFFYHLSSVLRFTKGRKKLEWRDIINCNGRV